MPRGERILFYGDNSLKQIDLGRSITQFSHWNHTHTQNIKAKFIYTGVYLYFLGMWDSKEIIWFCVKLIRAYAKNWIIIKKKCRQTGEIHFFISYSVGFLLKFSFCYGPSPYDCLFSWTLCPRVMKNGYLGEENMCIPIMTVNFLSEHLLTMNLKEKP